MYELPLTYKELPLSAYVFFSHFTPVYFGIIPSTMEFTFWNLQPIINKHNFFCLNKCMYHIIKTNTNKMMKKTYIKNVCQTERQTW